MTGTVVRIRREVVVLVVAAIALAALFMHDRTFSSSRWRTANLETQTRAHMTSDLLRSRRLIGMTRAQVTNLLGPPNDTDKFQDWDLVYVLGPQEGYIDYQWLVLKLDSNGKVSRQELAYD